MYTVKVLLFVANNFRSFYKIRWSLGSWIRGFKHYRQQSMGKMYCDGFLFSWFKRTTKSAKIRTPRLKMISQYVVIVTRALVLCVCFVERCLSFCHFSFGQCVVCPSSIYGLWFTLLVSYWLWFTLWVSYWLWFTLLVSSHSYYCKLYTCMLIFYCSINIDIKFSAHDDVSGITFIRYAQSRKIGKPNNLNACKH